MNMKEFYNKYNLNKNAFAPIAGVGVSTLGKYMEGKAIREDSRLRIEKAMRLAEKYNLVRPKYDHDAAFHEGRWYKSEFYREVCRYEKEFKEIIKRES